jgi:8-oxo-dGTP pyrophosphatase MutT (NUDIX family)
MHRKPLLDLLARYLELHPREAATVERIRSFVQEHEDCLLRRCVPGHITASAWILSADRAEFLLGHHRKLGRWLQLGGHVDGEPHVERAALREAQEESGMRDFDLVLTDGHVVPLDLDVHPIPPHGSEPAHFHYDVRFLLIAHPDQPLRVSSESKALRWFPMTHLLTEASLARLAEKATRVEPSR